MAAPTCGCACIMISRVHRHVHKDERGGVYLSLYGAIHNMGGFHIHVRTHSGCVELMRSKITQTSRIISRIAERRLKFQVSSSSRM